MELPVMPEISVVMSTFNENEIELNEAVNSILSQTFSDFEFIIVDDNPADQELKGILKNVALLDDRVRVIYNEKNLGLAISLNRGIEASRGKYIARMDADDISLPDRFRVEYEYLESHHECAVVSANRIIIDENGREIDGEFTYTVPDDKVEKVMKYGSVVVHPSTMIRKSSLNLNSPYRNIVPAEDYDLWLRMLADGKNIHILQQKLLKYRIRNDGISRSNFIKQFCYHRAIYRSYLDYKYKGIKDYDVSTFSNYLKKYNLNDNRYVNEVNKLYHELHNLKSKRGIRKLVVGLKIIRYPILIVYTRDVLIFNKLCKKYKTT